MAAQAPRMWPPQPLPAIAGGSFAPGQNWTLAEVLRSPALWWMMVAYLGYGAAFTLFTAHGVLHLRDLGLSPAHVASSLSLFALLALCGTLFVGAVGDYMEPRLILSCRCSLRDRPADGAKSKQYGQPVLMPGVPGTGHWNCYSKHLDGPSQLVWE